MCHSRAIFKPLANLSAASVRALSTTRPALQAGNYWNPASDPSRSQSTETDNESQYSSWRPKSNDRPDREALGRAQSDLAYTVANKSFNVERMASDRQTRAKVNFMTRLGLWKAGDVYAPHDLTGAESSKWRRRAFASPTSDAFDTLALDPLKEYKNFSILSNYMSEYGRIRPRRATGLKPKNQRKLAKAIRRSIGLGIMPSVHAHPESIWNTSKVIMDKI